MPIATGTSAMAPLLTAFWRLLAALPGLMIASTGTSAIRAATISAPAQTSHLSCARSAARARR